MNQRLVDNVKRIPEPLSVLVEQIARLPGLGPKSAMRVAMTFLKWPEAETQRLGRNIYELRQKLHLCQRCGALADTELCPVCSDPLRSTDTLCLVAEWDSMLTLEEGAFFKGQYFILGGLLSPLDNQPAQYLEIEKLLKRLAEGEVTELILALGATAEAEATSTYVREKVLKNFQNIRITRLAQGIPLGAEVKFMDRETLRQSLKYRQEL